MIDHQSVEIFNSWDLYDNIVRNNWMRHEQMAQFIRDAAAGAKLSVLDLGCGDGAMARNGLSVCQVAKYVGVDLSQDALEHLQRSQGLGSAPEVIRGDLAESIAGLASESFDLVLASYSLHHFQRAQKESILRQIRRVLRATGKFLWIDIACMEDEDRDGYVARIEGEIRTAWVPMPQKHCEDAIEHIRNHDFPERQSWMIQAWDRACGLESPQGGPRDTPHGKSQPIVGYRDSFYVALCLD